MNSNILKNLRKGIRYLTPRPKGRTGRRKSVFIDHNDYGYLNNIDNTSREEKGPQLVKKKVK